MTIFHYLSGTSVDVSRVRLRASGDVGFSGLSSAADGSMAQGAVTFEDPTDDLTVTGWMSYAVDEPDCTSAPRLFTGYIADRTYARTHYVTTNQRTIDTTINDTNVLLASDIFFNEDSPARPQETDDARMAWLLATPPMSGRVYNLGLVNVTGITIYDAENFAAQGPLEVLQSLTAGRDSIFFTYWDQTQKKVGLFFDSPTATTFTCSLTFSNVLSDVDDVSCFEPYTAPQAAVDPSQVYCRVEYVWKGNRTVVHSQTTHDAFFQSSGQGIPTIRHRSIVVENDRIGKAAQALSRANALLTHYSSERSTINFSVRLPSTKVGLVQAGMRVGLRFIHLPGFTTTTYTRIETLTISPTDGDPTHYDLDLTCSTAGLSSPPSTGGGSTQPFPSTPPALHYASGTFSYFSEGYGSSGGPSIVLPGAPNSTSSVTGDATVTLFNGVTYNYHFLHTLNAADLDTGHQVGLHDLGTWNSPHLVTPGGFTTVLYEGSFTTGTTFLNAGTHNVAANAAGASHVAKQASMEWWIDPSDWSTSTQPPLPGKWILGEVPTPAPGGGRVTFTTAYPFTEGSLRVWVDQVDQTAAISSSNGPTRSFTLAFDPRSYETITVDYQVI